MGKESVKLIDYTITEKFHFPLYMDQNYPLHISSYKLVDKIPISAVDPQPTLFQCGKPSNVLATSGIIIPELASNCMKYCNLVTHFLHAKLMDIGS